MTQASGQNIAVVGGGAAGIVSAYLLQRGHQVTLFEKNDYVGGHTHTVVIKDGPDAGTPVDTGFIVHNDRTYPNFIKFLGQLGVERVKCPMCFSYYEPATGFCFASSVPFADPKNLFSPAYWKFLADILRFNRLTLTTLNVKGGFGGQSLGDFLGKNRFSRAFISRYIIPMGAAIWSTPDDKMMEFPAQTFARFFENHGLLSVTHHPQWFSIKGGSHEYVKAFLKGFSGKVFTSAPVRRITRENGRIRLFTDAGESTHDAVVLASHADETLSMLADPSPDEVRLLSAWRYNRNHTVLHTDPAYLPPIPKARSSWNYLKGKTSGAVMSMTYYMNMLHGLNTATDYCVTLNPPTPVPDHHKIADFIYTHPQFSAAAVATQEDLERSSGERNTFFCGAYLRYGFHEDAVLSAVRMAEKFGISL